MNLQRVTETAERLVAQRNLPGLVVGVANSQGGVLSEGFGFADVEAGRPQSPTTRHRIGSVTKAMTALCVMALVDERRLSLDDRVVDLLPELDVRGYGQELLVHHLLAHVGGVGGLPTPELMPRADEIMSSRQRYSAPLTEWCPNGIEIEVPPGTKWAYANHGYGLLAEIVVKVENAPINEVMRARIFEPLGMDHSDVLDHRHSGLSRGYLRPPGDHRSNVPLQEFLHIRGDSFRGAGAGQSTMTDMIQFASALLRSGDGIVRADTYRLMTEPHWCPDPRLASQAFAFRRLHRFGRLAIAHGGGIQGWATMLTVLPADDLALVTFINLASTDLSLVDSALLQALLDEPLPARADTLTDSSILQAAPGTYQCTPGTLTNLRVIADQGRVFIERHERDLYLRSQRGQWREGVRMKPVHDEDPTFFYLDSNDIEATQVVLVQANNGSIRAIRSDAISELVRAPDD
jgi:CubicO group peptidase (beta-lactamase class C family)